MNFHGGYHGKDKLKDFSVNIPPIEFSESFKDLILTEFDQLQKYPELSGQETIEKMSKVLGYPSESLILGNGATELIYLYARTVSIQKALIIEPTFTEYRRALETHGVPIVTYDLDLESPGNLDLEDLIDFINQKVCDLLVICNPNNPTGHIYTFEDLKRLLEGVKVEGFKLFIDESFIDFVPTSFSENYLKHMKTLINQYPIFLLRSMTKTYSVPGLRIGYGIGNEVIIKSLYRYKEPWSLNTFALLSIPFFLEKKDAVEAVNIWSQRENEKMAKALSQIKGLRLIKGLANYHLIEVLDERGTLFFSKMLERGYYLRTCKDFIGLGDHYFRIALQKPEDNEELIKVIAGVMSEMEAL